MRNTYVVLSFGVLIMLNGCATSHYQQGRRLARAGDNAAAVASFYSEIETHPASHQAWRELGVSFFEQGELPRAEEALKQAAAIKPDARTHLYLGLVYEKLANGERALRAYRVALGLDPRGETRDLLESRAQLLVHEQVIREAQAALASEQDLAVAHIPDNTVAVVAFDSSELPPELAPLAKGMAEFTAQDLGKIASLRLVDRLKINAIQQELNLSQSEMTDPATAPRLGRLVGGQRIVTGALLGLGDESFRVSGAVVNTTDKSVLTPEHTDGTVAEFFLVQKQFVFDVIASLDITLTPEERAAIEEVPTENLLALMAYCRGLEFRDNNQMAAASTEFQGAATLDKGFSQASTEGRSVSSLLSMGAGGAGGNIGEFSQKAEALSANTLNAIETGAFQTSVIGWNGFVPANLNLNNVMAGSPPHTRQLVEPSIIIRGNLDVRP